MKWVRIDNGIVAEIIPEAATIPSIAHWYNEAFAAQCVEAPDEVEQRWTYDTVTGTFAPPAEPEPEPPTMTTEEAMLDLLTDLDYRTSLLELGITGGM